MTKDTMIKHKAFKPQGSIIVLLLIILKLVSITGTDFNPNNTLGRGNDSVHLQHPKMQSFINERYTWNKTTIHDTVIRLENTSIFLSNTIIIGSKMHAVGMVDYFVIIENCTFKGSEIVIESASNVTIVYSHFTMGDLGNDEEPNYVIKFYNTGSLFMTETHFGFHNQNGTSHSGIIPSTNLGLRIENVSMVELKYCSFNGIKAEKSSGSAMFLQNTEVLMISCQFYLNMAKYGVIFGTDFVSITSINSSYISNYAGKSGAVFYLTNSCSLTNDGSVFQNNSARKNAGVVYATYDITINNSGCLFQHNSAKTGSGGVIWMQYNCKVTNKQVYVLNMILFCINL